MEIVPIKNDTTYIYAIKLLESKLVVEAILSVQALNDFDRNDNSVRCPI